MGTSFFLLAEVFSKILIQMVRNPVAQVRIVPIMEAFDSGFRQKIVSSKKKAETSYDVHFQWHDHDISLDHVAS